MKQEEILKGNLMIALFMEWKIDNSFPDKDKVYRSPNNDLELTTTFKFNSDWSKLMPVIDKIGKTIIPKEWLNAGWDLSIHYSIHSVGTSFEIGDHDRHISDSGIEAKEWLNISKEPITKTWLAVIEFIKWYNEQKNK